MALLELRTDRSFFYLHFILLCIFPGVTQCTKNTIPFSSGSDLVDWNRLPPCAHGSCYVIYQLTVCPKGGLTRSCFCHNMMRISDHCLPHCSASEIEQVGLWEAEQCSYPNSKTEPRRGDNKFLEKRSGPDPNPNLKSNININRSSKKNSNSSTSAAQGQASNM